MLLNQLFLDHPINFEKRCRTRILLGIPLILLGIAAIILSFIAREHTPILYLEAEYHDFIPGFYMGTGCGLIAASIVTIIKNIRYLKNPDLCKERAIFENDERNRMLGLRTWAYTGYTMMVALYIGILVSGFLSIIILKTLLVVIACYALLLLIFRLILQKIM